MRSEDGSTMASQGAATTPTPHDPERASPWWWLILPLAAAVMLSTLWRAFPDWFQSWFAGELGVVEMTQLIVSCAALALSLRLLAMPQVRRDRLMTAWLALATVACVYIVGEEASWGQHLFGWRTPETWQALNDQGETNLHNVSSWMDQKPRALFEIAIGFGGIVIPLAALARPALRRGRFAIYLPPLVCLPVALIAEAIRNYDRLVIYLGGHSLLVHRTSEVQELYFYLFIVFYLIILRRRLLAAH